MKPSVKPADARPQSAECPLRSRWGRIVARVLVYPAILILLLIWIGTLSAMMLVARGSRRECLIHNSRILVATGPPGMDVSPGSSLQDCFFPRWQTWGKFTL